MFVVVGTHRSAQAGAGAVAVTVGVASAAAEGWGDLGGVAQHYSQSARPRSNELRGWRQ